MNVPSSPATPSGDSSESYRSTRLSLTRRSSIVCNVERNRGSTADPNFTSGISSTPASSAEPPAVCVNVSPFHDSAWMRS